MEVPLFTPVEGENFICRNYLAFYTTTLNGGGQVYNQHRFSVRYGINEPPMLTMVTIEDAKAEIRRQLRHQFPNINPVAPIFITGIVEVQ